MEYTVKNLRPLRGMCILKRDADNTMTSSGLLHVPEGSSMVEKSVSATVVAMGGFAIKKGKEQVVDFGVGSRVMSSTEAGWKQAIDGEDYYFAPQDVISTVITQED